MKREGNIGSPAIEFRTGFNQEDSDRILVGDRGDPKYSAFQKDIPHVRGLAILFERSTTGQP
jgi:hypothetical protein